MLGMYANLHTYHSGHKVQLFQSKACRSSTGVMAASGRMTAQAAPASSSNDKPVFTFGVISDVQYADIPDGVSFHGVPRFYRNSLIALRRAVSSWKQQGLPFAFHFGDIIDGFQAKHGRDSSEQALTDILDAFNILDGPTYHMLGNHCLYNLPRACLNERLGIPTAPEGGSYYSFSPHPAWRFVVLDAYDVSLLGWPEDHPRHIEAEAILNRHNPNKEKNSPEGLVGVARRFVRFGGGVSEMQLEWLQQEVKAAGESNQNVIICCHLPLYPGTCPPACLAWNYEAVLDILHSSDVVVATIAGHTHQNGYLVDSHKIHHLVLPAVLETPPGRDAYGWVEVYEDRVLLNGVDTCMSCKLQLQPAAVQRQQQVLQQLGASSRSGRDAEGERVAVTAAEITGASDGVDIVVQVDDEQQQYGKASDMAAAAAAGHLAACTVTSS